MKGRQPWILGGVAVVLIVGAFFGWRMLSPRESTDDAQVKAAMSVRSPHASPAPSRPSP